METYRKISWGTPDALRLTWSFSTLAMGIKLSTAP